MIKREWTTREFQKMLRKSGFKPERFSGSHCIYVDDSGRSISIPEGRKMINRMMAQRLIKEFNLAL